MVRRITPETRTSAADLRREFGVPRNNLQGQYLKSEARIDTVNKEDYRKMWQNDGQIAAIVQLPQLLILGAGFQIIADGEEMDEELEFVTDNLLSASSLGGMRTPINDVITDMTYYPFEGARFYELVFKADSGRIKLDKIAPRDNITCYPASDDHGDFIGFYQRTIWQSKTVEVFIPQDKAVALVYRKAYGGLNGMPILRPVWYHWDKKHKLYFIAHLAAELQTIPPKHVKFNSGQTQEVRGRVEDAVDEIGLQARISTDGDVEIIQLDSTGTPNVNIKELIDHHNSLISKALLAQWIDLGSEGSNTGSRSLVSDQLGVYYQFLQGIMTQIENAFNDRIIPQLIDFNFASRKYPKLKFNPISDDLREFLINTFTEMLKNGRVPTSVEASIVRNLSDKVGLEYEEEEMEVEQEQPEEQEVEEEIELAENTPRALLQEEEKVDFVRMQDRIDKATDELYNALRGTINREQVVDEAIAILRSGDLARLSDLQVANKTEVSLILQNAMRDMYDTAKVQASDEIDVPAQPTAPQARTLIQLGANTFAGKMVEDLKSRLIGIARDSAVNGLSDEATRLALSQELSTFIDTNLKTTASQNLVSSMNQARLDTFQANPDDIIGYTYSAVLDSRTTDYCRSLDGKQFRYNDPNLAKVTPPNHFNCRSMLVPILKGEEREFTSTDPKSFTSLYTFKNESAF